MKKNKKQIAAMAGILLLAALYLFTFVTAFLNIEHWDRLFMASIAATVGVPILIWIYIWLYGKITDSRTIASIEPEEEQEEEMPDGEDEKKEQ